MISLTQPTSPLLSAFFFWCTCAETHFRGGAEAVIAEYSRQGRGAHAAPVLYSYTRRTWLGLLCISTADVCAAACG